jgi:hypothetical protein
VPYQTKAERERARWMTLTETLEHISNSEGCDQSNALTELRKVLGDQLFGQSAMQWADRAVPPFGCSGGLTRPDDTPVGTDWYRVRFRLKGNGTVLDNWTEYGRTKAGKPRWRKLLFLRERVKKQWPSNAQPRSPEQKPLGDPKVVPFDQKKQKGPIATKPKIVDAAKPLINRGRTPSSCGTWEKFRRELCHEAGVVRTSRGWQLDTVQNAVRPLLKKSEQSAEEAESTES